MKLTLFTSHSVDGIKPGAVDLRVFSETQLDGSALFLVREGNFLQTIDEVVDMGKKALVFGKGAVESQEERREAVIEMTKDYE